MFAVLLSLSIKVIMKEKKQFTLFLVMLVIVAIPVYSQKGLYILNGANLVIKNTTLVSIDSLVLTPSADFTITGENSVVRNASLTHPDVNPNLKRAFLFSSAVPSFSGSISIYYQDKDLNSLSENSLSLDVFDGINWNVNNSNLIRDTIRNFITVSQLNTIALNELTLSGTPASLPISLTLFKSICISRKAKLTWKTSLPNALQKFEVEKSAAGRDWQVMGTVNAINISNIDSSYTFTDSSYSTSDAHYRIIIYGSNGRKFTSDTLQPLCTNIETFTVYPNPVHDIVRINITAGSSTLLKLKLLDAKGALVKVIQTPLIEGSNQIKLDVSGLAKGLYILNASWSSNIGIKKIVKE
jgi:hypothetical protein